MDINGDGHISQQDGARPWFKEKYEDADAMRDAQRNMAWFALLGMLVYPFAVVGAQVAGYEHATDVLGDMAPTYFVAVAGLVAAFFGATAWSKSDS